MSTYNSWYFFLTWKLSTSPNYMLLCKDWFSIRALICFQGTLSLPMSFSSLGNWFSHCLTKRPFALMCVVLEGNFYFSGWIVPNASLTSSQLFNMIVFLFPLRSAYCRYQSFEFLFLVTFRLTFSLVIFDMMEFALAFPTRPHPIKNRLLFRVCKKCWNNGSNVLLTSNFSNRTCW